MPHKRNPERSEHLDTLARLTRANAGVLLEGMVGEHERDGRSWKAEWVALPEVCLLAGTATHLACALAAGLEVDADRMQANLEKYLDGTQYPTDVGAAHEMIDLVVERARKRRAQEPVDMAVTNAGVADRDPSRPAADAVARATPRLAARARAVRAAAGQARRPHRLRRGGQQGPPARSPCRGRPARRRRRPGHRRSPLLQLRAAAAAAAAGPGSVRPGVRRSGALRAPPEPRRGAALGCPAAVDR